jgi:hypothetical protein
MIKFTEEQIQERFKQLPKEVQEAVTSADVHDKILGVAKKYGLHVDQEGELVDQIGLIMLGLSPSKDFVKNFSSSAEVDVKTATSIAEDINKEIFDEIRESMREIEHNVETEQNSQSISDIERVGGFNIENSKEDQNNNSSTDQPIESHEDVINAIENPSSVSNNTENILIDHFLSGPIASVEKKVEDVVPVKPVIDDDPVPQKPKPPKGPDQYREPIV